MPVRGVVEFGSEWLRKSKEPASFLWRQFASHTFAKKRHE
jgi:hypothetical protein